MLIQTLTRADDEVLDLPILLDLFSLWQNRRKGDTLPSRSDFTVQEFKPWLGNLCVVRRLSQEDTFHIDLHGTHVAEKDGSDFTGHEMSEAIFGKGFPALFAPFRKAIEERSPVFEIAELKKAKGMIRRLLLPCAQDGVNIDKLILAIYPDQNINEFLNGRPLYELYARSTMLQ